MPKSETRFVCQSCGVDQPRWYGQCPSCGEWNTLVEESSNPKSEILNKFQIQNPNVQKPVSITEVEYDNEKYLIVSHSSILMLLRPGNIDELIRSSEQ